MLVHPVSSSSQWELPLNPTVGHNLLKGAAPPDVRSVCDGIAVVRMSFAELSSMPWSSEGACLQCGRWVGAGNFAYSNVWLGIMSGDHCRHQVMLLSSSMETTIRKLPWSGKGNIIEATFALGHRTTNFPSVREFIDSLDSASQAAARLAVHVPKETTGHLT